MHKFFSFTRVMRFFEKKHIGLIRASDLFDADWYLSHYPDVAKTQVDPAIHYLEYGGFEGRDPGPNFSSAWYLETNDDVRKAGINPLIHYLRYGKNEGRNYFKTLTPQLNETQGDMKVLSFLSSYISEIGINILNNHHDNYDYYRFGEKEETLNTSHNTFPDAGMLSSALVDSVKIVEPFLFRFESLFNCLVDDESRGILVKLLAYKALGYKKVKLPQNTPGYWKGIKEIENVSSFSNAISLPDTGWILPFIDLYKKGVPVTLFGLPFGIFTQFILEHYKCVSSQSKIEVEAGDFVIDAGACWGDTALYFANLAGPSGRVFSYEFVPGNLEIFSKNMDLNPHLKNRISIIKNAAWESSNVKVSFSDTGPGTRINIKDGNKSEVETLSIDDLVALKNISHVDFIKMDIEGSELAALRGAIKTLKTYRPKLAISIYHKFMDYLEIPEFILSLDLGYCLYIRHFTIHAEETVLFAKVMDV